MTLLPLRLAVARVWPIAVAAVPLLLGASAPAFTNDDDTDITRLTLGRPVYPEGAWVIEAVPTYLMNDVRSPALDTVEPALGVEHAFTDRLSLRLELDGAETSRTQVRLGDVHAEGRFLAVTGPIQIAPTLAVEVPFAGEAWGASAGAEALWNLPWFTLRGALDVLGQDFRGGVSGAGSAHLGAYWRFGLNGILGAQLEYDTHDGPSIDPVVGGRISQNLFVALEPQIGINRGIVWIDTTVQLTLYWGPFWAPGLD